MLVLPLWVASWEFDCCGHDVRIGDVWRTRLLTHGRLEPGTGDIRFNTTIDGRADICAEVLRPALGETGFALLRADGLLFGGKGVTWTGLAAGRVKLNGEWHGPWPGVERDDIAVEGTVVRIRRLAICHSETTPGIYRRVGHDDPVDIDDTRSRAHRRPPGRDDLLIDLEMSSAQ